MLLTITLSFMASALAAASAAADDTIRIPLKPGSTTVAFVVDGQADVHQEAATFCSTHLSGAAQDECASTLVHQVSTRRRLRQESAGGRKGGMPEISFDVRTPDGQERRFTHEEGSNPAQEAEAFCELHFSSNVPFLRRGAFIESCVETMLEKAQKALNEKLGIESPPSFVLSTAEA